MFTFGFLSLYNLALCDKHVKKWLYFQSKEHYDLHNYILNHFYTNVMLTDSLWVFFDFLNILIE